MLRRIASTSAVAFLATSLLAAASSAAPIVDRAQVGDPDVKLTRAFSPGLGIALTAPGGYERGCCYDGDSAQWLGPDFVASHDPAVRNRSSLWWDVTYVRGSSLKTAATRAGWYGVPIVSSKKAKVRHVVALKTAGRLKAHRVIGSEKSPGARAEGAVAIGLGKGVIAVVSVHASDPPVDDAGSPGPLTVNGKKASVWNREQVTKALNAVRLQGNLPPRRIAAKAKGRQISGRVTDAFGHPLSDLPLELRAGGRIVATAETNAQGRYAVNAPKRGAIQVTTKLAGTTARSAKIRVR